MDLEPQTESKSSDAPVAVEQTAPATEAVAEAPVVTNPVEEAKVAEPAPVAQEVPAAQVDTPKPVESTVAEPAKEPAQEAAPAASEAPKAEEKPAEESKAEASTTPSEAADAPTTVESLYTKYILPIGKNELILIRTMKTPAPPIVQVLVSMLCLIGQGQDHTWTMVQKLTKSEKFLDQFKSIDLASITVEDHADATFQIKDLTVDSIRKYS